MDQNNLSAFWHFFHLYRAQLGYGLLAAAINALAHYKKNDSARDSFVDVLFCGAIGWGVDAFLRTMGMNPEAAVLVAAMIGYIGATGISDMIKSKLGLGE
ncbi:phage holin family protein [Herbiconiux daphne]|uniref:Phage holin family protein n=1 Tax=Herbiconiux daphne TaxID=2970914 RepID=A0ABT2HBI5_9MICO|nr:phage holin family protein [Herbiconiux daphne]MCS5737311.1 phage holin family protein [Herbiconiux daphne]